MKFKIGDIVNPDFDKAPASIWEYEYGLHRNQKLIISDVKPYLPKSDGYHQDMLYFSNFDLDPDVPMEEKGMNSHFFKLDKAYERKQKIKKIL